jgi:hypothetical protein
MDLEQVPPRTMARAYSADMRERVIARVESGASRREAAEHYEVSASAGRYLCEVLQAVARPRAEHTSPLEHAEFLLDEPDLTLDEVLSAMASIRFLAIAPQCGAHKPKVPRPQGNASLAQVGAGRVSVNNPRQLSPKTGASLFALYRVPTTWGRAVPKV